MKNLGLLLLIVAFLGGSYFSVRDAEQVEAPWVIGCLVLGALGVGLIRSAQAASLRDSDLLQSNIETIERSLGVVVERVTQLQSEKDDLELPSLRDRIDSDFPEELDAFVQARQSLAQVFGLEAYAEVMNPFSAGERYLNRTWSAATDGYIDDAHTHLERAREQFVEALETFKRRSAAT